MAPPRVSSALFDRGFNGSGDGYGRMLEGTLRHRGFVLVLCRRLLVVTSGAGHGDRPGFLPRRRRRPDQAALPRPAGTRIETTEQLVLQVEDAIREDHSRRRTGYHQRHGRRAVLVQPRLRAERQCRRDGCGDPDLAQARPSSVARLHPRHPRQVAGPVPGRHVLFPDCRYRQPGAEFRAVGADRRADPGREFRAGLRCSRSRCCSA